MIDTEDLIKLSPIVIIAYLLIRDLVPKIWPDLVKLLANRVSTEERLFKLLEQSKLSLTLNEINERLERVEKILSIPKVHKPVSEVDKEIESILISK